MKATAMLEVQIECMGHDEETYGKVDNRDDEHT